MKDKGRLEKRHLKKKKEKKLLATVCKQHCNTSNSAIAQTAKTVLFLTDKHRINVKPQSSELIFYPEEKKKKRHRKMCASKKNCDIKLRMQNRQKEVKKVPHSRGGKKRKRETPTSISASPSDELLNMTTLAPRIKY